MKKGLEELNGDSLLFLSFLSKIEEKREIAFDVKREKKRATSYYFPTLDYSQEKEWGIVSLSLSRSVDSTGSD